MRLSDIIERTPQDGIIKKSKNLLYSYIGGSHLYNLNTPQSDVDIRGVFIMDDDDFLKGRVIDTLQDGTADTSLFEIGKFCNLLHNSTPNALECLYGDSKALYLNDKFKEIFLSQRDRFLSKRALKTLCGYAYTQIKRATGYNKKCTQEKRMAEEGREYIKPNVLDFCFVATDSNEAGTGSMPIKEWLEREYKGDILPSQCGLAKIKNSRDGYHLFIPQDLFASEKLNGIVSNEDNANDVQLCNIEKGHRPVGVMFFNKDAYSTYCREYKEYLEWVKHRNPVRYEHNLKTNYDTKNMSHTFRLLHLGLGLLETGTLNFVCEGELRDYLMKIKNGYFEYEYLESESEKLYDKVQKLSEKSSLKDEPDHNFIDQCLMDFRKEYYNFK